MRLVTVFILDFQKPALMFPHLLIPSGQLQIKFLKQQNLFSGTSFVLDPPQREP